MKNVSVIVPAYNSEKYIENCIISLLSMKNESESLSIEIIIVDNGSNDKTADIIKKYPVKYFLQDKIKGSYASRNCGLTLATGEIIAFTDSDCVVNDDWLVNALKYFEDQSVGGVAGAIQGGEPSNYIEKYLVENNCLSQEGVMNHFFMPYAQTANAIYRRSVFDRIGFFEESWVSGGDADLSWRMQIETNFKLIYAVDAVIHHIHRSSLKGFFRQRKTWGYGEVLLCKKYLSHFAARNSSYASTYKKSYWQLKEDFKKIYILVYRFLSSEPVLRNKYKLDILVILGRRYGRLLGSYREKFFFI